MAIRFIVKMKDRTGRQRHRSQGGAGPKHLPTVTHGTISGTLTENDCPQLGEHGRKFWLGARASLESLGILERMDATVLEMAAATWDRIHRARAILRDEGEYTRCDNGKTQRNPAMMTLEHAESRMKSLLSELGLTPSARAKFQVEIPDADPLLLVMQKYGAAS